nr:uncharacterized protein LOC115497447 [Taeniopygia guttata]
MTACRCHCPPFLDSQQPCDISDSRSLPCPPTERRISSSPLLLFTHLCVCAVTRGRWLAGRDFLYGFPVVPCGHAAPCGLGPSAITRYNRPGGRHRDSVLALEQSPDMVIKEGQSVNLECSKKKTSNRAMYWFVRHSEKNSSLTQLVYAFEGGNPAVEKGFESHFKSSKIKGDSITLSIEHAFLNDSGTYYCAESDHSGETAEGAEHKLLPAHTGPAFHLVGAAEGFSLISCCAS